MKGPIEEIPLELKELFTMKNKIPIYKNYKEENNFNKIIWDNNIINRMLFKYNKKNIDSNTHQLLNICKDRGEPYPDNRIGGGCSLIQQAIDKYSINNKSIGIIGSTKPWIECICLNNNARKITTVEYNIPKCENKKFNFMSYYEDFKKNKETFDIIISYSSIEHSGLGRYGDNLDPDGDKKTINDIYNNLDDQGYLFLGIPIGNDALVWNANRIYGNIRLPYILEKFEIIEWIGCNLEDGLKLPKGSDWKSCYQPVIILRKKF